MEIGVPKTEKLVKILKLINEGRLRIPEFQRDFRWEINDICELIGSLLSGYPAGVLLFWDVSDKRGELSSRLIEGVGGENVNPVELLILDGQQRLTSLYQLFYRDFVELRGGRKRKFFLNLDKIKKGDLYESTEYFSLRDYRRKGLNKRSEQYRNNLLPFNIILNEKSLRDWIRGYVGYKLSNTEKVSMNTPEYIEEYRKLEDEFHSFYLERDKPIYNLINYEFHVIELPSNLSFEAVATIFEKLNTRGQPLNIFEILTAKFFKDINLREIWVDTRRKYDLIDKFSKDEKDSTLAILILKAILLQKSLEDPKYEKLECKRKNLLEDMTSNDVRIYWQKIAKTFNLALSKLKVELGCPSLEYLPYTTILVPFSLAINYIENKLMHQKASAYKKLFAWYWSSVFSGRYDSATDTKSKLDIKQLTEWFTDDEKKPIAVREFDINALSLSEVTRGAAYKGVLNILIINNCKDFVTGETIKGLIESNSKLVDSHHIFPIKYLKRRYGEKSEEYKLRDSVLNRTLIRKDTNRHFIKDDPPSSYIQGIRRRNVNIDAILETHLIPKNELLQNDFLEFLKKRENLIKKKIKENLCVNN